MRAISLLVTVTAITVMGCNGPGSPRRAEGPRLPPVPAASVPTASAPVPERTASAAKAATAVRSVHDPRLVPDDFLPLSLSGANLGRRFRLGPTDARWLGRQTADEWTERPRLNQMAIAVSTTGRLLFLTTLFNRVQRGCGHQSYRAQMPPPQPCPTCQREGRWLTHSSDQAFVNYYRCAAGHVWTVPKNAPADAPNHVTRAPRWAVPVG
jgi:hypothetical protein